ncbi:MAG TPA: SIMPL domain-containing protein [Vicinamibacterales bacterium]|nr:SIMPL domain-containing protein [Vicinamibacterales bacterium]
MTIDRALVPSIVLAAGLAAGGLFIGNGFARGRAADRFVTVKGTAERNVRADLAIWPLRLVVANNDLAAANAQIQASVDAVRQFLQRHHIDPSETSLQDFSVTDAAANQFGPQQAASRYVIHETVVVRSERPDLVLAASQQVAELVTAGVVLSSGGGYGSGGPTFTFSGLNTLKPAMIAEATARAREAAEQFARNSHSQVGGIREANQGVFEILPRDQAQGITEASQILKTVRVVSTIQYFLRG